MVNDSIEIRVEAAGWTEAMADAAGTCRASAAAALAVATPADRGAALSVLLSDDDTVRCLNRTYRGRDEATNVLSFAQRGPSETQQEERWPRAEAVLLGDIVVAFGVTAREADAAGRPIADHLSHLIVHGVLHLLGYDHEDDAEAEIMEQLETRVLAGLGVPDPYEGVVERQT